MKIDRLVATTSILLNKGLVTARELAERFEVSTRTIYRDIEVLAAAGVPVYATQGNGGGIALMEGYALDKTLISEREQEGIVLALQTLQAVKFPEVELILDKLGALFKNASNTDWVEVDFSPWGSGPDERLKFKQLQMAILERRVIEFDYLDLNGKRSNRTAEPLKLVFKARAWYLWAWCQNRTAFRTFKVVRMRGVVLTEQHFERKSQPHRMRESSEDLAASDTRVELHLRFQSQALHRLYDDYDEGLPVENPDGTWDLRIRFPLDEWAYGYLLSFGPLVEVIEPEYVRKEIQERLRQAWQNYESGNR